MPNAYFLIGADYLMRNNMDSRNLYFFLWHSRDEQYFYRSFFPEVKMDYIKNQVSWTILLKKRKLVTNKEVILYDRLKKNEELEAICFAVSRYSFFI